MLNITIDIEKPLVITREVTNCKTHHMSQMKYEFLSLETLIKGFEDMYKEDKLIFEYAKKSCVGPKRNIFFDEAIGSYTYTFTVKYVSVYVHIDGLDELVNTVYGKSIYGEEFENI